MAYLILKSKEEGKNQEPIQSITIPDPGHHMGKWFQTKPKSDIFCLRFSDSGLVPDMRYVWMGSPWLISVMIVHELWAIFYYSSKL